MEKYIHTLKKVGLFDDIDESDLLAVLNCLSATVKKYEKNETILMDGDDISEVGIVLEGKIQITKEDYLGNRNILTEVGESGLFGEAFSCAKIKRIPVSVVSVTDSTVMFINYMKVISVCSSSCNFHLKLIENMLYILAQKNIMLNQKIEFISKRTTREKLLVYLNSQVIANGMKNFEIPYNRQELADFLCVDRSAMSKELSRLRDEGIIMFNKNHFEIM